MPMLSSKFTDDLILNRSINTELINIVHLYVHEWPELISASETLFSMVYIQPV